MKKLLKTGLVIFLLLVAHFAKSQDINFSQFYELPLLRNPALAGIFNGDVRVTAAFRSQWQSVTVPYRTMGLGVEYKKPMNRNTNDFFTFGFQVTNDIAGDSRLRRTQVLPVFNFHKSLDSEKDTYLSAAVMGGPVMQRFDPSQLSFDDQFVNGSYSPANPTKQVFTTTGTTYWDAAVGLNFSSIAGADTRYYVAVGLFHFTKPKVAFQKEYDIVLNPKYVVNAGLSKPISAVNKLTVYADYFMQGGARQVQGGLLLSHDFIEAEENQKIAFSAGLFYRWNDALMPVIKLDYNQFGIGINYDVNISKLKTASQFRGAYEVTLSYKAFRNNYNSSADKVRCPGFY
ncbi:MAG TPA: PorP/SprF family type IX secretion system membrane protein [Ferruginibacter sp.]|nr:PorP/SprF family type IX secretion system membrane protein [Chitinophagaceae bacterium]HQW91774.1 PorP/SprF family type IX secretion system membrane protein [Ferruginibacter sp.]